MTVRTQNYALKRHQFIELLNIQAWSTQIQLRSKGKHKTIKPEGYCDIIHVACLKDI